MSDSVESFGVHILKQEINNIPDCILLSNRGNDIALSPTEIQMLKDFFLENRL